MAAPQATYNTLEEIRLRKEQLDDAIDRDSERIGTLWSQLFHAHETNSRGEYVAAIVANSVTAIDAFLLVRKLMKNYGGLLSLFSGSKRQRRKRR